MSKEHQIIALRKKVRGELEADVAPIVEALWGKRPPDMAQLSEEEYLGYVRRHWPDPNFRQSLLVRVGPKNFLVTYADAFGIPRDVALSDWLPPTEPTVPTEPTEPTVPAMP